MNRLFKRVFLLFTVLLTLLCFLFLIYVYYQGKALFEEQRRGEFFNDANERISYLEREFLNTQRIINTLSTTPWVIKRASQSSVFNNYFDSVRNSEITKEMQLHCSSSPFIEDVIILFPQKDFVVGKLGWDYSDSYFRGINVKDIETQKYLIKLAQQYTPMSWEEFGGSLSNKIFIVQSLEVLENPRSTAIIVLDKEKVQEYITHTRHPSELSFVYQQSIQTLFKEENNIVSVNRFSKILDIQYNIRYKMPIYLVRISEYWVWFTLFIMSLIFSTNASYLLTRTTISTIRKYLIVANDPLPIVQPDRISTDVEISFIQLLKAGNAEKLQDIFQNIKNSPPAFLFDVLRRVMEEFSFDTDAFMWQKQIFDMERQVELLYETSLRVCERALYKNNDLGLSLYIYIKDHWWEQTLSLKLLSDVFKISESRVSHCFKEYYGVNYHKFLTRIRMEKAKAMLRDGQVNVANLVGYAEESSFRRAFLVYQGISIQQYQELQKVVMQNNVNNLNQKDE